MAYAIFAWALIKFLAILVPAFEISNVVIRIAFIIMIIGLPIWGFLSWHFEMTADGFKKIYSNRIKSDDTKTKGRKLDKIILSGICLIIVLLIVNLFRSSSDTENTNLSHDSTNEKSIAVLAFTDMSPQKDQEYFSDGISDEIINLLSKVTELKVISRISSFSFKGKDVTTEEIGELLNVNHILDGSIKKSGNTLRISTQLIDTKNGVQQWSKSYDRPMNDIFKIQDEIANFVLQELKISLLGDTLASTTVHPEAYNLYLEAKLLRDNRDAKSDSIAENLIRKSIAIDKDYAPAWAILSELIYSGSFSYSRYTIEDGMLQGKDAANKSRELDPNYPLAYASLASFDRAAWDFKSADINLKKAIELGPNNDYVIYEAASNALDLGRLDEAIYYINKSIRIDPVNYLLKYTAGLYYLWNEEYEKAAEQMEQYIIKNPQSGFGHNFMSQIYLVSGQKDKALEAIQKDDDPFWRLYRECIINYTIGDLDKSNKQLKDFIKRFGHEGWPNVAHIYACRDEHDEAFRWLDLSYEQRDPSLLEILNYPEFKNLYDDHRWNPFIDKLGLPDDHGFYKN
jgi:TolB-like protein/Tfp pilus assembly protein PilF